jgi:hypothetical protein
VKNILSISIAGLFVLLAGTSCQKKYERPDLTPETDTVTAAGLLLTKMEINASGTKSTYTYSYDKKGRLADVAWETANSGQNIIYQWSFLREDTSGKCLAIHQRINSALYPATGILFVTHYASASAPDFDYMVAGYMIAGNAPVSDSTTFTIAGGKITKYNQFVDYMNTGYQNSALIEYTYDNNGNVTNVKNYGDDGTGTGKLKLIENIDTEFDTKVNPLQLGQEGIFLNGQRIFSKNNIAKSTTTNYASSATGIKSSAVYAITYNAENKPVSAIVTDASNANSVATMTYTYNK